MKIEALLGCPPERDELVVQLFAKEAGQLGEIYREKGAYWICLWPSDGSPVRFPADHLIESLSRGVALLRERLEP